MRPKATAATGMTISTAASVALRRPCQVSNSPDAQSRNGMLSPHMASGFLSLRQTSQIAKGIAITMKKKPVTTANNRPMYSAALKNVHADAANQTTRPINSPIDDWMEVNRDRPIVPFFLSRHCDLLLRRLENAVRCSRFNLLDRYAPGQLVLSLQLSAISERQRAALWRVPRFDVWELAFTITCALEGTIAVAGHRTPATERECIPSRSRTLRSSISKPCATRYRV